MSVNLPEPADSGKLPFPNPDELDSAILAVVGELADPVRRRDLPPFFSALSPQREGAAESIIVSAVWRQLHLEDPDRDGQPAGPDPETRRRILDQLASLVVRSQLRRETARLAHLESPRQREPIEVTTYLPGLPRAEAAPDSTSRGDHGPLVRIEQARYLLASGISVTKTARLTGMLRKQIYDDDGCRRILGLPTAESP